MGRKPRCQECRQSDLLQRDYATRNPAQAVIVMKPSSRRPNRRSRFWSAILSITGIALIAYTSMSCL